jgi:hypothetical protein
MSLPRQRAAAAPSVRRTTASASDSAFPNSESATHRWWAMPAGLLSFLPCQYECHSARVSRSDVARKPRTPSSTRFASAFSATLAGYGYTSEENHRPST